jgi:hypothetical protein
MNAAALTSGLTVCDKHDYLSAVVRGSRTHVRLWVGTSLLAMIAAAAASMSVASGGRMQSAAVSDAGLIAFALDWTPNAIGGHTSVICGSTCAGTPTV